MVAVSFYNKYTVFKQIEYTESVHCTLNSSQKGDRTELRSTRNCVTHESSKHTELRSARNFETHGTTKRTELRKARNFENVFEARMYLMIPEPIL